MFRSKGEDSKRKNYLPDDKQFLITKNGRMFILCIRDKRILQCNILLVTWQSLLNKSAHFHSAAMYPVIN